MLDLDFIRENLELVKSSCAQRRFEFDADNFIVLDDRRRAIIKTINDLRQSRNKLSDRNDAAPKQIMEEGRALKVKIKESEDILKNIENNLIIIVNSIPNILLPSVPEGNNEKDNIVLREYGVLPKFDFNFKSYLELGEDLNLIDIPRATKIAGSRFSYLKNELVLIQFALLDLVFEIARRFDFQPVIPPVMIKPDLMEQLGYTSLKESNIYLIEKDELNLVGTAEQSIAAMHQEETLSDLPKRYIGYSTCFRREAGTYGRELKGILRVHQFDKAELFSFCHPEKSQEEHDLFIQLEEEIMQSLNIPYRVVALSSGDLSKPSATTVDIESWLPSESRYLETHSSSNCTDYQARGLNIFCRNDNKLTPVHTVNGTALAMSRILAVILENYQQANGSIAIPKVLQNRLNFKNISK